MYRCVAGSALLYLCGRWHAHRHRSGDACQQTAPFALTDLHGPDPPLRSCPSGWKRPAFGFRGTSMSTGRERRVDEVSHTNPASDIVPRGNRAAGGLHAVLGKLMIKGPLIRASSVQ
jgi:hypothetical protein